MNDTCTICSDKPRAVYKCTNSNCGKLSIVSELIGRREETCPFCFAHRVKDVGVCPHCMGKVVVWVAAFDARNNKEE